jgi:oligopeptide transport system substrate-binding protein
MQRCWMLFGLIVIAALAPGCRRDETRANGTPVRAGNILRLGNGAEPQDLDPHVMTAFTDQNIALALFEGLCAIDEKSSKPVAAAAEKWQVAEDGLVWTFFLRDGLTWSNGEPLRAADFIASWRRALDPQLAAEYAYLLHPIRGAASYNRGDSRELGVEAPDDRTLRITLERPTPYLPALTANPIWFPVNLRALEKHGPPTQRGSAWTRPGNLVGNGPFILAEWSPNAHVKVVRNPAYWDASAVRLDGMTFFPTENQDVDERNFRAGQVDITSELPLGKVDAYRRDAPQSLRLDPFLETFFLRFNTTRKPFDDARVRRALSMAIDRGLISRTLLRETRAPAPHYTPPECAGYTSRSAVPTDVNAARRLLAEAGFPEGRGFPAVEVQVRNDALHSRVLETIQAMWARELGIQVTIAPVEQKTWIANQQSLNYAISSARWVGDFVDPVTFLDMYVGGGTNNWTGWANAEYDAAIATAADARDESDRHASFQRAEKILLDETPIAPIFFGVRGYLINARVEGWEPALLGFHQYKKVRLK